MTTNKIVSAAEEMKQKLFGKSGPAAGANDRFHAYLEHIGKTVTVPIEHITIEDNVRKQVDVDSPRFQELVESIKREGLLQNLIVDVRPGPAGTYLSCVSGQRRLLAAKAAGIEKAVCLLKQYDQAARVSVGLTENLMRQDLHCIDVAEGYAELRKNGWSEEQIAERFERGQRTIHRYLLIASWPADVKTQIRQHADIFSTRVIFNQFVSRSFANHQELRQAVKAKIAAGTHTRAAKTDQVSDQTLSTLHILSDKLQTNIKIKPSGEKGRLEIGYRNQEELQRILALLALA
jgi:ParB family chromosome partitioning protein